MEKDESPKAKALPRLLIVAEGPCQICSFFIYNFFRCNFGPNCFESPYLFLFFCSDTLYVLVFFPVLTILVLLIYELTLLLKILVNVRTLFLAFEFNINKFR